MRLTVITPCYQAENLIEDTLYSVLRQRGDFELQYLIIDGGSTDGTIGVVKRVLGNWQSASDSRPEHTSVELVSEPDGGMYDALRKGMVKAEGDVISYINAGDFYLGGALQTVAELFAGRSDIDWISGYRLKVTSRGGVLRAQLPYSYDRRFIRRGIYGRYLPFIHQESTFMRRALIDELDLDELASCRYAGDFYLWHQFSKRYKLHIVNCMLAAFKQHPDQLSEDLQGYRSELKKISGEAPGLLDWPLIMLHLLCWHLPAALKKKLNQDIIEP